MSRRIHTPNPRKELNAMTFVSRPEAGTDTTSCGAVIVPVRRTEGDNRMRGITKLSSLAVLAFMTTLVCSMPMSAGDTDKDWTVLLYNDGDNNLESYALTSVSQLAMIGSDENVNLGARTD